MKTSTIASLAFAVAVLGVARAAPIATDAGASVERIAEDVYMIMHADATDEWPHSNVGVGVYDDGVFVIDSTYLPSRAKADIELIRGLTTKPVRYLTTTHWHFDHNNGASAYREAFPEVTVLYERATDHFIDVNTSWWPRMSTAEGSARLDSNEILAATIESGVQEDGAVLTPDRRRSQERYLRQRRSEIEELKSLRPVRADIVFDGRMTLTLGGRTIELEDRGRANSPHDVTIYLPQQRILFAGDIVVQSPLPYTGASWPVPWVDVLANIESEAVDILVPGHGPVMHDLAYVGKLRLTFAAILERVEALVRQGRTLEQIQAEIELDDLRAGYAIWNENVPETDWKTVMTVLVERAFRGVRGQG
jgi:cyclase